MSTSPQRENPFLTMPIGSVIAFLLGVGALFAGVGAVTDSLAIEQAKSPALLWSISVSAVSAVLWAFMGSMRMRKGMLVMGVAQAWLYFLQRRWFPRAHYQGSLDQLMRDLSLRDAAALIFIFLGYLLFILFFRREGKRFFATHTEMELAAEIQKNLVPPVSCRVGNFELYGISIPSGRVGGDLVDVVTNGNQFFAYIADIAGHGVAAGVLMSMVKSAVHMRTACAGLADPQLLSNLNGTLQPLTAAASYLTFAYVSGSDSGKLVFSLAAHPPLLHCCSSSGRVVPVSVQNLPVGMFPTVEYETGEIDCRPGDLVVMLTDGLTEIFDKSGKEAGLAYIEETVARAASQPLQSIAAQIMKRSELAGVIADDRSVLLMRCLA